MAANIYGRHFAERNGLAWWGGAKRLEGEDGKATTAVRVAGVGFPIYVEPLYYRRAGIEYAIDNVAIIRPGEASESTAWVKLGVASSQYTPITNYRVAELLDPLTDRWPAETCGALGKGEDFFITLNAGRAEIAGEEIDQYFFVWNKHDGTGALRVMFTPVRVVCQNTCILGAEKANVTTSVIHTRNVDAQAQFAINLTVMLQEAQRNAMGELARFAKIKVGADDIRRVLAATYPVRARRDNAEELIKQAELEVIQLAPEQLGKLLDANLNQKRERERAARLRVLAYERYQAFNDEYPQLAETGWALYQAITEVESHGKQGPALIKSVMLGGERAKNMSAAYTEIAALTSAAR